MLKIFIILEDDGSYKVGEESEATPAPGAPEAPEPADEYAGFKTCETIDEALDLVRTMLEAGSDTEIPQGDKDQALYDKTLSKLRGGEDQAAGGLSVAM